MDNYFSDMEAGRLHWVAFSFFAALAIGVMALLSSLFMSTLVALLFAVVFDIFYVYFAFRFVNYAHQFHAIERAMADETPIVETRLIASLPADPTATADLTGMHSDTLATRAGYSYESYFIRQFRSCTGFSPANYRRQKSC
ncbi:hypothetical protein AGMMS50239_02150 [Bacteroidia bacterium]|nr:hypothetical protein AGMMS50239_02150 [Bacteroidia bacterium]